MHLIARELDYPLPAFFVPQKWLEALSKIQNRKRKKFSELLRDHLQLLLFLLGIGGVHKFHHILNML